MSGNNTVHALNSLDLVMQCSKYHTTNDRAFIIARGELGLDLDLQKKDLWASLVGSKSYYLELTFHQLWAVHKTMYLSFVTIILVFQGPYIIPDVLVSFIIFIFVSVYYTENLCWTVTPGPQGGSWLIDVSAFCFCLNSKSLWQHWAYTSDMYDFIILLNVAEKAAASIIFFYFFVSGTWNINATGGCHISNEKKKESWFGK